MTATSTVQADELACLEMFADIPADDLMKLAANLKPMRARGGEVLMRQGDPALSFVIIASGDVEVRHTGPDGRTAVAMLSAGMVVGEIALLRNTRRTGTVIAIDDVSGYVGRESAFHEMLEIPDIAEKLVRTARQRLAAFITPLPVRDRDGAELMIRPVLPGDTARFAHGHVRFSGETLYKRFLSVRTPTENLLRYLFEVDYVDHFVWVITDGADGPVVADGRFVRDENDHDLAEIAFMVADSYQGRGIGSILFSALAVAARVDGVEQFTARALADNAAARGMLDRFGAVWERDEPGIVAATIDVPQPEKLPLKHKSLNEIGDVARQVIQAFD